MTLIQFNCKLGCSAGNITAVASPTTQLPLYRRSTKPFHLWRRIQNVSTRDFSGWLSIQAFTSPADCMTFAFSIYCSLNRNAVSPPSVRRSPHCYSSSLRGTKQRIFTPIFKRWKGFLFIKLWARLYSNHTFGDYSQSTQFELHSSIQACSQMLLHLLQMFTSETRWQVGFPSDDCCDYFRKKHYYLCK